MTRSTSGKAPELASKNSERIRTSVAGCVVWPPLMATLSIFSRPDAISRKHLRQGNNVVRPIDREEALEILGGFFPGRDPGDQINDLILAFSSQDISILAACFREVIEAIEEWEFSSVMPLEVHEAEAIATELEGLAGDTAPQDQGGWRLGSSRLRHLDWLAFAATPDGEPGLQEAWFRVSIREFRSMLSAVEHIRWRDPAVMASSVASRLTDIALLEALHQALTEIGRHAYQMTYQNANSGRASVEASVEISTGHAADEATRRLMELFPQTVQEVRLRLGALDLERQSTSIELPDQSSLAKEANPIEAAWSVIRDSHGSTVRLRLRCEDQSYLTRVPIRDVFARCDRMQEAVRSRLRAP